MHLTSSRRKRTVRERTIPNLVAIARQKYDPVLRLSGGRSRHSLK